MNCVVSRRLWGVFHHSAALGTLYRPKATRFKRNIPTSPPAATSIEDLRCEVLQLTDHVRVLTDVLDDIRSEMQWLTRNGLPSSDDAHCCPVLKRMAADWSERLVIARGNGTPPLLWSFLPTRPRTTTGGLPYLSVPAGAPSRQTFGRRHGTVGRRHNR